MTPRPEPLRAVAKPGIMSVGRWTAFILAGIPLLMGTLLAIVFAALRFSDWPSGPARALGNAEALLLGVPALLIAIYATVRWAVRLFVR
jgi:hypothetical protein